MTTFYQQYCVQRVIWQQNIEFQHHSCTENNLSKNLDNEVSPESCHLQNDKHIIQIAQLMLANCNSSYQSH